LHFPSGAWAENLTVGWERPYRPYRHPRPSFPGSDSGDSRRRHHGWQRQDQFL